jgi:hypothetical protein
MSPMLTWPLAVALILLAPAQARASEDGAAGLSSAGV